MIKKGSQVIIHPNSNYYAKSQSNPDHHIKGVVSKHFPSAGSNEIYVKWDNGQKNIYREYDLFPLKQKCKVIYQHGHLFILTKYPSNINRTIIFDTMSVNRYKLNQNSIDNFLKKVKSIMRKKGKIDYVDVYFENKLISDDSDVFSLNHALSAKSGHWLDFTYRSFIFKIKSIMIDMNNLKN